MKHIFLLSVITLVLFSFTDSKKEILPVPATEPNEPQLKQIERKYGMFIHFGINTFHDMGWTDGSKPASSYNPSTMNAEQWVRTAKNAGMRYVI